MNQFMTSFQNLTVRDIVDILLVTLVFFSLYRFFRETRALQLVRGIVFIFIFSGITSVLNLYAINWLLSGALTVGMIAIMIVFQPELRRALEIIGRGNLIGRSFKDVQGEEVTRLVDELLHAISSLSRQKMGALIVLEQKTGLGDVIETGTTLDAKLTSELLINIFIPNTPLHDGAVIVKEGIIRAAACFLPLSDAKTLDKDLGTRHRAAIGMSERSDALVLVVSEETGAISYAEEGSLSRYVDEEILREKLTSIFTDDGFILDQWRKDNDQMEKE